MCRPIGAEEGQVRANLLAGLEKLTQWDAADSPPGPGSCRCRWCANICSSQLELMPGSRGEYLIGGVTISALQPMRPLPFAIVYVLGLGENLFPGSNALSSFDLRGVRADARRHPPRRGAAIRFSGDGAVRASRSSIFSTIQSRSAKGSGRFCPRSRCSICSDLSSAHVLRERFSARRVPMQPDDARVFSIRPGSRRIRTCSCSMAPPSAAWAFWRPGAMADCRSPAGSKRNGSANG